MQGMSNKSFCNIELLSPNLDFFAKVKLGGYASIDTSLAMLLHHFGCSQPLRHALSSLLE